MPLADRWETPPTKTPVRVVAVVVNVVGVVFLIYYLYTSKALDIRARS